MNRRHPVEDLLNASASDILSAIQRRFTTHWPKGSSW